MLCKRARLLRLRFIHSGEITNSEPSCLLASCMPACSPARPLPELLVSLSGDWSVPDAKRAHLRPSVAEDCTAQQLRALECEEPWGNMEKRPSKQVPRPFRTTSENPPAGERQTWRQVGLPSSEKYGTPTFSRRLLTSARIFCSS